ncbi:hypothetical protein Naga_100011g36 [Nannochloropsis gaditana]|uniref:Uncharacterized protein n=1 Tax=Nannochloropsis gaditana TaxID=72520 RepID=W7T659_9STRA|nr:hypothetical protein Naga_100011g36 [Nannochloropsis gaditana]
MSTCISSRQAGGVSFPAKFCPAACVRKPYILDPKQTSQAYITYRISLLQSSIITYSQYFFIPFPPHPGHLLQFLKKRDSALLLHQIVTPFEAEHNLSLKVRQFLPTGCANEMRRGSIDIIFVGLRCPIVVRPISGGACIYNIQ